RRPLWPRARRRPPHIHPTVKTTQLFRRSGHGWGIKRRNPAARSNPWRRPTKNVPQPEHSKFRIPKFGVRCSMCSVETILPRRDSAFLRPGEPADSSPGWSDSGSGTLGRRGKNDLPLPRLRGRGLGRGGTRPNHLQASQGFHRACSMFRVPFATGIESFQKSGRPALVRRPTILPLLGGEGRGEGERPTDIPVHAEGERRNRAAFNVHVPSSMSAPLTKIIIAAALLIAPVAARAQLEIVTNDLPAAVISGGRRTVPVTLRNSAAQPLQINLRLQLNQASSATALRLGSPTNWKTLQIAPGQTVLDSFTLDYPSVRAETRFIVQCVNDASQVLAATDVLAYPTNILQPLKT